MQCANQAQVSQTPIWSALMARTVRRQFPGSAGTFTTPIAFPAAPSFWRWRLSREASMVEAVRRVGSTAKDRPALSQASDAVIASGLSVHVFGGTVGIYSERIESGRGFAEFPVADLLALIRFFALPESRKLLDLPD